jgi:hypothetical protein
MTQIRDYYFATCLQTKESGTEVHHFQNLLFSFFNTQNLRTGTRRHKIILDTMLQNKSKFTGSHSNGFQRQSFQHWG